ncbi:MAG: hypothetical protein RMX65_014480 [Nostoc sp. DedQUE01]
MLTYSKQSRQRFGAFAIEEAIANTKTEEERRRCLRQAAERLRYQHN